MERKSAHGKYKWLAGNGRLGGQLFEGKCFHLLVICFSFVPRLETGHVFYTESAVEARAGLSRMAVARQLQRANNEQLSRVT